MRDRQHGGDRVDREDDVGERDGEQRGQQRRGDAVAVLAREERAAAELLPDRQHAAQRAHRPALGEVLAAVAADREPDAGEDQQRAHRVEHRVKELEQRHAGDDEHRPQHQRDRDAERQHVGLQRLRDRERAEQHGDHEHVVERERLLHQEAGPVGAGRGAAERRQHDEPEGDADHHPPGAPARRSAQRDVVVAAVREEQVEREEADDRDDQRDPAGE